jgi:hypothetical protein
LLRQRRLRDVRTLGRATTLTPPIAAVKIMVLLAKEALQ